MAALSRASGSIAITIPAHTWLCNFASSCRKAAPYFPPGRSVNLRWAEFYENGRSKSWEGNTTECQTNSMEAGIQFFSRFGTRRLWTSVPLEMGRRSAKIATRKGAQDARKAKLYGKIGKQIVSAVQAGGPNPTANISLATLLQQAKEFNVPKDIIDRNIKKASEKGQQNYVESTYEAYAFGSVGLVLEVLTDNANRTAALIRDVVKKGGGKMADPGSVLFNFKRAGVIYVRSDNVDGDKLLLAAMDAGAEDILEPPNSDEMDDHELDYKYYKVITPVEDYSAVSLKLQETGIPVDLDNSGLELVPVTAIEPDDEAIELNKELMEKLLEVEDVDAVYSNQK